MDNATLHKIAMDVRATAEERGEASMELQAAFQPEVDPRVVAEAENFASMGTMLAKSSALVPRERPRGNTHVPVSMLAQDNTGVYGTVRGGYIERPGATTMQGLKHLCENISVVNAIISTRVRAVLRFARLAEEEGVEGFEIRHKDPTHRLTKPEEKHTRELTEWFLNCGDESNPIRRKGLRRRSLREFLGMSIRDSLSLDACPIEMQWTRNGKRLSGIYPIDGASVYLVNEIGYEGDSEVVAVQANPFGQVVTTYTNRDLVYEVRNPRTDLWIQGYGYAEVEQVIRCLTGFLHAIDLNIRGFTDNSFPKGVLNLVGEYDQNELSFFRRQMHAMVTGTANSWRMPVLVSKDPQAAAKFEQFPSQFNEMYFSKWMTFLVSIVCACFGMDPTEINFESFSARAQSSLSGQDTAERLASGKDRGLVPLLSFYAGLFSDLLAVQDEPYVFRWVGVFPEDDAQEWEYRKAVSTVDELRALKGDKKHPNPKLGAAPLNPELMQIYAQEVQQEGQPGGEDFGQPDGQNGGDNPPEQASTGSDGGPGADNRDPYEGLDFGQVQPDGGPATGPSTKEVRA